jgi:hypothetical protein
MVFGDLLVLALLVSVAAAVSVAVSRKRSPQWVHSEWVAEHDTAGDETVVVVARKLYDRDRMHSQTAERRELGAIANDEPDYERKLLDLLEMASNRAVLLNSTPNG